MSKRRKDKEWFHSKATKKKMSEARKRYWEKKKRPFYGVRQKNQVATLSE